MPLFVWLVRLVSGLRPWYVYYGRFAAWLWRWLGILARNPLSWLILSFLPIIDLFFEIMVGRSLGFGAVMSWAITQVLNGILSMCVDLGYLQASWDALPARVLEISCWLGATEAIQFLFTGIASALGSLLTMKITLAVMAWRLRQRAGRWKTAY